MSIRLQAPMHEYNVVSLYPVRQPHLLLALGSRASRDSRRATNLAAHPRASGTRNAGVWVARGGLGVSPSAARRDSSFKLDWKSDPLEVIFESLEFDKLGARGVLGSISMLLILLSNVCIQSGGYFLSGISDLLISRGWGFFFSKGVTVDESSTLNPSLLCYYWEVEWSCQIIFRSLLLNIWFIPAGRSVFRYW